VEPIPRRHRGVLWGTWQLWLLQCTLFSQGRSLGRCVQTLGLPIYINDQSAIYINVIAWCFALNTFLPVLLPSQVSTSWRSSLAGVGTAEAAPSGREVTPAATPGGPVLGHSQAPVPQRLRELSAREAVLVPGDYSFSGETSRRSPSCTRGSLDAWLMQAAQVWPHRLYVSF
jgi:hypothetical protein